MLHKTVAFIFMQTLVCEPELFEYGYNNPLKMYFQKEEGEV